VNVLANKRVVVDASVIIDLYAAPDDRRASIAEEVMSWVTAGFVEAYAPKLLVVEVLGVLARYLSEEKLELVTSSIPPIKLVPEEVFYDEARFTPSIRLHLSFEGCEGGRTPPGAHHPGLQSIILTRLVSLGHPRPKGRGFQVVRL